MSATEQAAFPSRSQAIQAAVEEKPARLDRDRLARERAKLDPVFEKTLAEEGLSEDVSTCQNTEGRDVSFRAELVEAHKSSFPAAC